MFPRSLSNGNDHPMETEGVLPDSSSSLVHLPVDNPDADDDDDDEETEEMKRKLRHSDSLHLFRKKSDNDTDNTSDDESPLSASSEGWPVPRRCESFHFLRCWSHSSTRSISRLLDWRVHHQEETVVVIVVGRLFIDSCNNSVHFPFREKVCHSGAPSNTFVSLCDDNSFFSASLMVYTSFNLLF